MLFGKAGPGKSHGFLGFFSNYSSQKFGACRPVVNRNTYSLRLWFAHSEGHAHSAVLVALCRWSVGCQACGRNAHDYPWGAVWVFDALLDFLVWSDLGTSLNGCTPGPACTFELTALSIKEIIDESRCPRFRRPTPTVAFFFGIEVDSGRDRPQTRIFPSNAQVPQGSERNVQRFGSWHSPRAGAAVMVNRSSRDTFSKILGTLTKGSHLDTFRVLLLGIWRKSIMILTRWYCWWKNSCTSWYE